MALKEVMRVQLPQRIDDLRGADRLFGTKDDSPVLKKLQQLNPSGAGSFSTNPPTFPPLTMPKPPAPNCSTWH
ncbi:MAG: hypothetical protein CM1200mP2_27790 [Planctomycetaceae bacterium]|nr:MAG: hypothetical protein CM1200mP2_27790 [Planctomycetaceae bacterium]